MNRFNKAIDAFIQGLVWSIVLWFFIWLFNIHITIACP